MSVKHIAIILDGNRRYARKHGLPLYRGHEKGADNVKQLIGWAKELGVEELTLYSFSMQNFKRAKEEVNYLFTLAERFFRRLLDSIKKGTDKLLQYVQFNFIGRLRLFPKRLQALMRALVEKTKKNNGVKVNFALGYGGREEIVDTVNKLLKKGVKKIDEKTFNSNLYLQSEPDLIIRTGGEQRTSNFLPWQSTYSEWFFLKKTWPEFNRNDLKKIISQFNSRERRFGV
jgi:undecaprenyl diphosphate synthase